MRGIVPLLSEVFYLSGIFATGILLPLLASSELNLEKISFKQDNNSFMEGRIPQSTRQLTCWD